MAFWGQNMAKHGKNLNLAKYSHVISLEQIFHAEYRFWKKFQRFAYFRILVMLHVASLEAYFNANFRSYKIPKCELQLQQWHLK